MHEVKKLSNNNENFLILTLESLSKEWIYIVFAFIPWAFLLILGRLNIVKINPSASVMEQFETPPLLPIVGGEIFISNVDFSEWKVEIDSLIKRRRHDLFSKLFSFSVVVYYFYLYSFYSGKKLKGVDFFFPIVISLLLLFLVEYWSKLKYTLISIFALSISLAIPVRNDGNDFINSFRKSFNIFKENWLEMILVLILVLGMYSIVVRVSLELGGLFLEFLRLSYETRAIFLFVLLSISVSALIVFQIIFLTNYYLSRRNVQGSGEE